MKGWMDGVKEKLHRQALSSSFSSSSIQLSIKYRDRGMRGRIIRRGVDT